MQEEVVERCWRDLDEPEVWLVDVEQAEESDARTHRSLLPVSRTTSWVCPGVPMDIDAK